MGRLPLFVLLVSASLWAAPENVKTVAMKEAIKNAVGAESKEEDKGPDVSKMPFTPDSIRMVMAHHQPKVIQCYEGILAGREKPIEGLLMTWFVIDADGLVSQVKILKKKSTVHDEELNDCVMGILGNLTFPKTSDGKKVPIEFPFKLTAVR